MISNHKGTTLTNSHFASAFGKAIFGKKGIMSAVLRTSFIALSAFFVSLSVSGPAFSKVVQMDSFKDWSVFRDDSGASRVCYMSSVPKKLRGDYDRNNRGETRVFVTHFGSSDRNVVSVLAGYKYKKQSDVTMTIDGKDTTLFTQDNRAYSFNAADDTTLVTRMKRGNKMVITGISSRGNKTIDEYSLSGFTKAKALLDKLCK